MPFTPFAGAPFGSLTTPASPASPPTPTVISTAVGSVFVAVPATTVEFSDSLTGPWTVQPHCYHNGWRDVAAPEISQASLIWHYGAVMQPGATVFATVTPLDVIGKYARLTLVNWYDAGTNNLGGWNADTNDPNLVSGGSGEADGDFYTVTDAGTEELDGINDWQVGDVLIFRNGVWSRLTHERFYCKVATSTLAPDGNANGISTGKQTLTCYGLLWDAERKQVTSTMIETSAGAVTGDVVTINRGLSFNQDQRGEFAEHGNRSEERLWEGENDLGTWNALSNVPSLSSGSGSEGDFYEVTTSGSEELDGITAWSVGDVLVSRGGVWVKSYHVFSYKERGESEWSAEQSVRYLLETSNPWSVPATLDITSGNLDWLPKGGVDTDRRTVKAILDDLIQRQRGVGYFVAFDDKAECVRIKVFSFADVAVNMPNGTVLEANPNQYSLDFEASFDVSVSELNDTITTKYNRVVVEGDWRTVTCSMRLNPASGEFSEDWSAAEQQAYFDGASRESWYSSLALAKKQEANQKARSEDKFEHVFARFVVADDWDLLSHDPELVATTHRVFDKIDTWNANGLFEDEDCETWISGLTVLDHLPLRERYDYGDDHIEDEDWKDTITADATLPPFRKPFSFALTNVPRALSWELLDKIDGDALDAPDQRKWSVRTQAHHDRPAIALNVSGGHQQFLADAAWGTIGFNNLGNWDASANSPALSDGSGTEGDYYTVTTASTVTTIDGVTNWLIGDRVFFTEGTWRRAPAATDSASTPRSHHPLNYSQTWVTLTFEMSERVQIERRISIPADGSEDQVLRIPVKDCRLDYVVQDTVVGITNGSLDKTSGGFVRDDRERLDTFAKAAALWYGKPRQTLEIGYKQIRPIVRLGWLIVDVGPTYQRSSVNSVVTSITYDIIGKQTTFQTSYAELDLT